MMQQHNLRAVVEDGGYQAIKELAISHLLSALEEIDPT